MRVTRGGIARTRHYISDPRPLAYMVATLTRVIDTNVIREILLVLFFPFSFQYNY